VSRAPINSASATMWHGSLSLRDYPELSKLRELPSETLMRIDAISEACLADLDCPERLAQGPARHALVGCVTPQALLERFWRCCFPTAVQAVAQRSAENKEPELIQEWPDNSKNLHDAARSCLEILDVKH